MDRFSIAKDQEEFYPLDDLIERSDFIEEFDQNNLPMAEMDFKGIYVENSIDGTQK